MLTRRDVRALYIIAICRRSSRQNRAQHLNVNNSTGRAGRARPRLQGGDAQRGERSAAR
jgi:hypothetical protein